MNEKAYICITVPVSYTHLDVYKRQALDNEGEALANLNEIRRRAGISELTGSDVTGSMTLTDWVRNERFVELFEEGHRYYDPVSSTHLRSAF